MGLDFVRRGVYTEFMTDVEHVLAAALRLSPNARATVVAELLESLEDADVHQDVETAWADEIQKRLAEIDAGEVTTVSRSEALQRIAAAATGHREAR